MLDFDKKPEEYRETSENGYRLITLSAKSETALQGLVEEYTRFLGKSNAELSDICFTANTGRDHHGCRLALWGRTKRELAEKLRKYERNQALVHNSDKNELSKKISEEAVRFRQNKDEASMEQIALLYIQGGDIDWKGFYEGESFKKVSLPTYSFEKTRCWPEISETAITRTLQAISRTSESKQVQETALRGRDTYSDTEQKIASVWGAVLGFSELDIKDNYYELGGDSILGMKIVNRLNSSLNIRLDIGELLKNQTIEELAQYVEQKHLSAASEEAIESSIEHIPDKEYYKVSSTQKRIYILEQLDKVGTSYNIPMVLTIEGSFDSQRLEDSFKSLIDRHESLRTSFDIVDGETVQIVHPKADFAVEYYEAEESEVKNLAERFVRPFDLSSPPLIRVGLIKLSEQKHVLLMDMHHIISDGTSTTIFVDEFISLYEGEELSPLKIQYRDYAEWQSRLLESDIMKKQEEYWLRQFEEGGSELPVLNMPTDYPRPIFQSNEGDIFTCRLDKQLAEELKNLARDKDSTLFMVLLGIYSITLAKYSAQEDIVIGTVTSGRTNAEVEGLIGLFLNNIVFRCLPKEDKDFGKYMEELRETVLKAYENQAYPIDRLIEKLNIHKDMSRNALFDVMLILQSFDKAESGKKLRDFNISRYPLEYKTSKYDLTLYVYDDSEGMSLELEYCTRLFSRETIGRFMEHFVNIAREVVQKPDTRLSDINMVSEEEKRQIHEVFNNTAVDYDRSKTVHQLFEEQAERTPDNIALIYESKKLTYRQLNEKANAVAVQLRDMGVEPDSIVGIMIKTSPEMIIGILAILKAGGAYMPIDPEYPEDRIEYMLEDSEAVALLTVSYLADKAAFEGEILELDDDSIYDEEADNPEHINKPEDLIYIIYTSGSTGKPKGVMLEHRNVTAYINAFKHEYKLTEKDTVLQQATYCFDAFVEEVFPILTLGGKLVMAKKLDVLDVRKLEDIVEKHGINLISCSPLFLNELNKSERLRTVHTFISGGDVLKPEYMTNLTGFARVYNTYGPTEATVCATYYNCTEAASDNIPIGKPIANYRAYILDKNGDLCPAGVPGELCIAGPAVARGYLNRPDLTSEKFVPDPFLEGEKMYRTGDLVKWLPDGNIEFSGRIDHQVKIRGFRVELGEIESKLLRIEGVKEAAVVVREENGNKLICAYVVPDMTKRENSFTVAELRETISSELPDYMMPSCFVQLEKLPLLPSGKLDRKSLPDINYSMDTGIEYEAPRNETEEKLVKIWREALGVARIGINDSFFEMGGNSLKVLLVASKIQKEFNVEIPLGEVFKAPTVKTLAEYVKNAGVNMYSSIKLAEKKPYYPLSSAQKRVFVLCQLERKTTGYNMPIIMDIEGSLDITKVEAVFRELVKRHEALRTSFEIIDGEPVQLIAENADFNIDYIEMKENAEVAVEELLKGYIAPFDLAKAPLLRVLLVKISEGRHLLMYDLHHIIADGVSIAILVKEFAELYSRRNLPELRLQYKDFAEWQNKRLKADDGARSPKAFWLDRLSGELPVLDLSTDYPRPTVQSMEGAGIEFGLDRELSQGLKKIASETGSTLYMVLLTAYNILLAKYSGQEDIIIGSPMAGRPHADLENIIGMFVNTLAMRNYPSGNKSFREFLTEVRESSLKAFEAQDYQFEELVENLNIPRDFSRNPLFDVMFSMQNISVAAEETDMGGIRVKPFGLPYEIAKFDLALTAAADEDAVGFNMQYCTRLFKRETVQRMSEHLVNIIRAVTNNPDIPLKDIDMLSDEEKSTLLIDFNSNTAVYEKEKAIHQVFEEQVQKAPDNIAVVYGSEKLTYRELNERSNQLARTLRRHGLGKEKEIAALLIERSADMAVAILAVLKAGGAYLPIDPEYPSERIKYMLEDSGARILLTQARLTDKLSFDGDIMVLEDEAVYDEDKSNHESVAELESKASSIVNSAAYIIYTSGTTGKPKGVVIRNHSVLNLVNGLKERIYSKYEGNLRVALVAPYVFDASVKQIFPALLLGHTLYIVPEDTRLEGKRLVKYFAENMIDITDCTPIHLNLMLEAMQENTMEMRLKNLVVGGDSLPAKTVREILSSMKNSSEITNVYGPTECCDVTTTYEITLDKLGSLHRIPIGKPLPNTQVYILDKNKKLQPIGAAGELFIGGEGLAMGYLGNAQLTAEKFIQNPHTGQTMYKTGDMARWLSDGNIEILGRIDHQVKIRGFRIELGEIENVLLSHKDIKEAVVMAREDNTGTKYLCAYIVPEAESGDLNISELRGYLAKILPEYMIPSFIISLDAMPYTINGKIDRKALAKSTLPESQRVSGNEYQAPSNAVEDKLSEIWKEILGIDKISINDSFFELGGHSLKATILASRIHKELNAELTLREIFKAPTIKQQAELIAGSEESIYSSIQPIAPQEYYVLSSAQKRMYILQQLEKDSTRYNMPLVMNVEGELDKDRLENVFRKLVQRHETLRTCFKMVEGEPVQKIYDEVEFCIDILEAENEEQAETFIKEFVRPFDLGQAPLLRVGLIRKSDNEHILVYDMHHIISDGISMSILNREFAELYRGGELPELRLQYKEYCVWQASAHQPLDWQKSLQNFEAMKKQEQYWLKAFSGEIPVLNLPTDYPRPTVQSFEGASVGFGLDRELTDKIKKLTQETGTTMYMVLLAIYNVLLSKYSGQEDIIIGTPIAGRPHADLQEIIGVFVNTLAMRNYPAGGKSFRKFLREVRDNSLKAFEAQDYQFEELVEKLNITRDMSRNPLFDIMFSMQNIETSTLEVEGLKLSPYGFTDTTAKFDMTMAAFEMGETLVFELQYCTRLFKRETIERLSGHFVNIVNVIAANPDISLADIDMLSKEERHTLLAEFEGEKTEYPRDKTVVQLFEEQARRTPDSIAVVQGERTLSYEMLNERANSLARVLREKGLKSGNDKCNDIAAILTEPSPEMFIAIIAVLKAGGAYLPIDPAYPDDRIQYMLEDSGAALLLTQSALADRAGFDKEIVNLEDMSLYTGGTDNIEVTGSPTDLAYIIYTSGSTGRPKGVMVEHRALINLCFWHNRFYGVTEKDRATKYAGVGFDASVWEIFPYVLTGAAVHIIPNDIKLDVRKLNEYYEANDITISFLPTQMCEQFMEVDNKSLRKLLAGGDKLRYFTEQMSARGYELVNNYGPTENTVVSTCFTVEGAWDNIPIGKPVHNTSIYILDRNNSLQPIGVPGELCISGESLARGYLNMPELTEEKFVPNPFVSGQKMYRTGDLARWLPDGNLEFLGRIDYQVKIRGFRIELGEIESRLLSQDGIKEAVVIDKDDDSGSKYLAAYLVPAEGIEVTDINISEIRSSLAKQLPDYMIPSYFAVLERLPLNASGKIDRKALYNSTLSEYDGTMTTSSEYEAPVNELEEKLTRIWREVLGIEKIGVCDSFFELGGHSLKAITLANKIQSSLGVAVQLGEIFKTPTIRGLANYIEGKARAAARGDNTILMREGTEDGKNIFLIHDGSGDIGGYLELVKELNPAYSCWGLRADVLEGYTPAEASIEELSARYIARLRTIQQTGPYHLAAWSLGGVIAVEIARQLEQMGEKVQSLALIDSYLYKKSFYQRLAAKSTNVFETAHFTLASEKKAAAALCKSREAGELIKAASTLEEVWPSLIGWCEANNIGAEEIRAAIPQNYARIIPNYEAMDIRSLIYYLNTIRVLITARDSYTPSDSVTAPLLLFKARDTSVNGEEWNKYLNKPADIKEIRGNHFSIMRKPTVELLAQELNKQLTE